ncbi:uncharacterized protein LOC134277119 [Saccostrea cucullata]|uniref:uncharacterized protein LOC134277119 n=1 Tax=Saccostrea cuccullata TaxID=36930 RepID=UPI002ED2047D
MSDVSRRANCVRVGDAVKEVFAVCLRNELTRRIPPTHLQTKLNEMSRKKCKQMCLSEDETRLIKKATLSNSYEEIDFSFLYKLLRKIDPGTKDKLFMDDMTEMSKIRNKWHAHLPKNEIEDQEFSIIWKGCEEICKRMDQREQMEKYFTSLDKIKHREVLITYDSTMSYGGDVFFQELNRKSFIISTWKEEDDKYYETSGCKYTERLVDSKSIVTIVGPSGCGKSAMAQHIALKYKDRGWMIIPISDIEEFYKLVDTNVPVNQMYVLHDPLGKESINDILLSKWISLENIVEKYLESNRLKLLVTTRVAILNDKKCIKLLKTNLVPLHEKFPLCKEEKKCILMKHFTGIYHLSSEERERILNTEHYFPLLCSLFGRNEKYEQKGSKFFTEPTSVISKEIAYFKDNDRLAYLSLILLLSTSGILEKRNLSNVRSDIFKEACELCGVDYNTPKRLICEKLDSLVNVLVKIVGGNFLFYHDFIMDVAAYTFASDFPDFLIKICPLPVLRKRVFIKFQTLRKKDDLSISLPEEYADALVDRILTEMGENFTEVFLCPAFENYKIRNIFINRILTMDDNHFQRMFLTTTYRQQNYLTFVLKTVSAAFPDLQRSLQNHINLKEQANPILTPEKEKAIESLKDIQSSSIESRKNIQFDEVNCSKIGILGSEGGAEESTEQFTDLVKTLLNESGLCSIFDEIPCTDPKEMKTKLVSIFAEFGQLMVILMDDPDGFAILRSFMKNIKAILIQRTDGQQYLLPPSVQVTKLSITSLNTLLNASSGTERDNYFFHCIQNFQVEQAVEIFFQFCRCVNLSMNMMTPNMRKRMQSLIKNCLFVQNVISNGTRNLLKNPSSPFHSSFRKSEQMIEKYKLQASSSKEICLIRELKENLSVTQTLKNNLALLAEEVSPLLSCIIYGDKKIVEAIIERVKRIENGKDIISNKIFLAACLNGSVEIAHLLLELKGEDILYQKWNCSTLIGLNALHIASLLHHSEMTAFLLDKKFPVNTIDGIGRTPLIYAISSFHKDMSQWERQRGFDTLETLFNNGANTLIRNLFGASAFHCACELIDDMDVFKHFLNENVNDLMDDATSPLMLASKKGNTNIVRLLLQQNASVNHHNEAGHAPIHYACISGVIETVTCLLDYGAKPDDVDNLGMSPLMLAAANGHIDVVQLLSKISFIDQIDQMLNTALHYAAKHGHLNVVKILFERGANVNHDNKNLDTPIFFAASNGHYMVTNELINLGADVNKCNISGKTPLMQAVLQNHINLTELLLDRGSNVNIRDANMRNAIWFSASQGHEDITTLLLHKKAEFNISDGNGLTPLTIAAKNGKIKTVSLLHQLGCNINEYTKNHDTPLILAASEGHNDVVSFLISHDADINLLNKRRENALLQASANGHEYIVKILIDASSDITPNCENIDPLYIAAANGYHNIVDYLVISGPIENTIIFRVDLALLVACREGRTSTAKMLITIISDINVQDEKGRSALWFAVLGESEDLVNVLLDNDANVNMPDKLNKTPLMIASEKRHGKIIVELLRKGARFAILIIIYTEKTVFSLRDVECIFYTYTSDPPRPILEDFLNFKNFSTNLVKILSGELPADQVFNINNMSISMLNRQ